MLREVYDWAHAKEACLAGDTRAFLERAELILANGRRETTLWYATALDFSRVCEAVRPAATAPFREDVRADFPDFDITKSYRSFMHAPPLPVGRLPFAGALGWHLWVHMRPKK